MFGRRPADLSRDGTQGYKSLKDYTNVELISYLDNNMNVDLSMMARLLSEILRRMNEIESLLPEKQQDAEETK